MESNSGVGVWSWVGWYTSLCPKPETTTNPRSKTLSTHGHGATNNPRVLLSLWTYQSVLFHLPFTPVRQCTRHPSLPKQQWPWVSTRRKGLKASLRPIFCYWPPRTQSSQSVLTSSNLRHPFHIPCFPQPGAWVTVQTHKMDFPQAEVWVYSLE